MRIKYLDINGDSGVEWYEIGHDSITVWFRNTERAYKYTYLSAGRENVEKMKSLADAGDGLNRFINLYVRDKYEK